MDQKFYLGYQYRTSQNFSTSQDMSFQEKPVGQGIPGETKLKRNTLKYAVECIQIPLHAQQDIAVFGNIGLLTCGLLTTSVSVSRSFICSERFTCFGGGLEQYGEDGACGAAAANPDAAG